MPSLSEVYFGDPFDRHATAGGPNDDLNKIEELKKSFNGVHDMIRESMHLNIRLVDVVIDNLEWALDELDKPEEEFDHTALFQGLKDSIREEFDEFYNLYVHAEEEVNTRIHGIHGTIYPFEANSYDHYINDCHKDKVDEMIVTHLYRQGLFDVGYRFVIAYGDVDFFHNMTDLRQQFKNLQDIINAVRNWEIELPLHWVSENRERLGETKASELEFKIHVIKYISMVEDSGTTTDVKIKALSYAKAHLSRFTNEYYIKEMEMLFCCVIYDSNEVRQFPDCRYFHIFDGSYKRDLIAEIERQFYLMMGQCVSDPLSTVTSVGAKFLSGICKAANIVKEDHGCGWTKVGELPLYVNLNEEWKFHSHFACPLMKDVMATGLNPPMALGCGHIISFQSMLYNSACLNRTTICPFCLSLTTNHKCKTVYF